jgi:hypothetical protein
MEDRKILPNCFLKSGYPSYMATFLLQKGETTVQELPIFMNIITTIKGAVVLSVPIATNVVNLNPTRLGVLDTTLCDN